MPFAITLSRALIPVAVIGAHAQRRQHRHGLLQHGEQRVGLDARHDTDTAEIDGVQVEAGEQQTFAELARETVLSFGGELIELRGDEALCVFGSARQALRSAVGLQVSFRRPTDDGSAFPLPIGIGLDAGEAVPIEGGYRGGALNTAARLCSLAGPRARSWPPTRSSASPAGSKVFASSTVGRCV